MSGIPGVGQAGNPKSSARDSSSAGFVLGLDVGSSVIRCHVYDRAARVRGSSSQKVTGVGAAGAGQAAASCSAGRELSVRNGAWGLTRPGQAERSAPFAQDPRARLASRGCSRPPGHPRLRLTWEGLTGKGSLGFGLYFPTLPQLPTSHQAFCLHLILSAHRPISVFLWATLVALKVPA